MAEAISIRTWRNRVLYLSLGFLFVFTRLLPLDAGPGGLPGPDLLVCLTFAMVLRRPDAVPVPLVAFSVLLTDFFFMRPLGLWTALVVIGLEVLRGREATSRDLPFLLEWMMVAIVIVAMTLAYSTILAVFAVDEPALGLLLLQMIATILAYPLVVLIAAGGLGIRRLAPGAVDELGRRL